MTKFKVGDKVRIIRAEGSTHENGDIGIIVSLTPFHGKLMHDVAVDGEKQGHYESDIELVESKPTKKQRVKALESEVATLKQRIEALEKAQQQPPQPKGVPVTSDNIAVGDKIRVLDKDGIGAGEDLTNGSIYTVVHVWESGGFDVIDDACEELVIDSYEYKAVEKVVSG